jgi:UDP-N-acetylmuramate dehydrogenase
LLIERAGVSSKHALALTNPGGDCRAEELVALARDGAARVFARFWVPLRPEVVALGVSDPLWG